MERMTGMTQGELHATLEMLEAHAIANRHHARLSYVGVLGASDLALVVDGVAVIAQGIGLAVHARSAEAAETVRALFCTLEIPDPLRREIVDRMCHELAVLRTYRDRAAELERVRPAASTPSVAGTLVDHCGGCIYLPDLVDCGCQVACAVAEAGCDVGCL